MKLDEIECVGLILVFNENYYEESIYEFDELVKLITKNSLCIAISNNPILKKPKDFQGVFLSGDNSSHEFSGWQKGLEHFIGRNQSKHIKSYIFANDTFCHHHKYSSIEKRIYTDAFKKLLKHHKTSIISGRPSTFNQYFSINDLALNEWISTYIFSLTQQAMHSIEYKICLNDRELEKYFGTMDNEDCFFSEDMNTALKTHLTAWLFGREGLPAWYKSEPLNDINRDSFIKKARSILREKLLTANVCKHGGLIQPITLPFYIRFYSRIKSIFTNFYSK